MSKSNLPIVGAAVNQLELFEQNLPDRPWGEVFGDTVVATAILDRLLHHSHVLMITGESFRLREKRRAGLKLSAAPHGPRQRQTT